MPSSPAICINSLRFRYLYTKHWRDRDLSFCQWYFVDMEKKDECNYLLK